MSEIVAHNRIFTTQVPRSRIPLIFVIFIGSAISFAAFLNSQQAEHEASESDFRRVADDKIQVLETKIQSTFTVLQSIRGLYAATDHVERNEFRRFVETLGLGSAVQALEWIPKVSLSNRSKMETIGRREGFSDFRFTQRSKRGKMISASKRETYFPVYYVEPVAGNEAAIGFDLASSPARLAALMRARDGGEAVATTRITLVQETSDQYGVLVFLPIYRNGLPTKTIEDRRANLAGFTLGGFRLGNLVENATKENENEDFAVSLQLVDETAPKGSQRLYPKAASPNKGLSSASEIQWSKSISVAGRIWRIVVTPANDSAFTQRAWIPWLILFVGVLTTGILAQYLKLTQNRAADIDRLVTKRTSELQRTAEKLARSNHDLEQFASVAAHDLQEPLRKV